MIDVSHVSLTHIHMDDDDANELCEAIQAVCDYAEASGRENLVKATRILREFKRILSS